MNILCVNQNPSVTPNAERSAEAPQVPPSKTHLALMAAKEADRKRFWNRVDKNGPIPSHRPELGKCWVWTGGTNAKGYGSFHLNRCNVRASRAAYVMEYGPISHTIFVCHHCDNRTCCNPTHLFLGTTQDNTADMMAKGRFVANPKSGSENNAAKLTEKDVLNIKRDYRTGNYSYASLAEKYGVTSTPIYRILTGRAWLHVIEPEESITP